MWEERRVMDNTRRDTRVVVSAPSEIVPLGDSTFDTGIGTSGSILPSLDRFLYPSLNFS